MTPQIRSANNKNWGLAGQNYRLFFDASKATFEYGFSMLSSAYQPLQLIQYVENIDASKTEGGLSFAKTLAFLNFAIDLSDTNNGGAFLSADGSWLTTAQLIFKPKNPDDFTKLEAIWGRDGTTDIYANSFVEVSEWVAANRTKATSGDAYVDLKPAAESAYIRVLLQGAYDFDSQFARQSTTFD
ncbi:MAG: hypothetical protein AAF960_08040 [Bacteroidota bacterium]